MNYRVYIAQDITDQDQVDQTLRKALDRSREQFTLSRRMSLARKPEAVLKTLMSASKLRIAKRASVLFFEAPSGVLLMRLRSLHPGHPCPILPSPVITESLNEATLFEDLAILDLLHSSKPVIVSDVAKDQRLTPPVKKF